MTHAPQAERTLEGMRTAARWFLKHACNDMAGRPESDPVYQIITEHRDKGVMQQKYSSCGDLAHWMLWRLGFRVKQLNREERVRSEPSAGYGWRVGQNVSQLVALSNALKLDSPLVDDLASYDAGDVLVVWQLQSTADAHVICPTAGYLNGVLPTAEYGQPGGELRLRRLSTELTGSLSGRFMVGTRTAQVWIPLPKLLAAQPSATALLDWQLLREIAPEATCIEVQGLLNEIEEVVT